MKKLIASLIAAATALGSSAALAQHMSAEEILSRINKQDESIRRERGDGRSPRIVGGGSVREAAKPAAGEATVAAAPRPSAPPASAASTSAAPVIQAATGGGLDDLPVLSEDKRIDLVIFFEFDSAFIKPTSQPQLAALCAALQNARGDIRYSVVGHTDASGSELYNLDLSQRRADEVKRHLIDECGVDRRRLRAIGAGEARLQAGVPATDERQRRVEIILDS